MLKFVSWNVNGLRAVNNKGIFKDVFSDLDADFFCLQETKLQEGQIDLTFDGYQSYWNYAEKKGYSGTAIFTRHTPEKVFYGIGNEEFDREGRVITLSYPEFHLVTVYTPNAKEDLSRLAYRESWEDAFLAYVSELQKTAPVIFCGDLNVAHKEIDLKNPKPNKGKAGFTDEERAKFENVLNSGFVDTFRYFYPDSVGEYTWWSYRYNARANNAGWRIDYFIVSDKLKEKLVDAKIHREIFGSDHCPVEITLDMTK